MKSQLKAARRARGLAIWGLSVMSGVNPSLLTAIEKRGYVPGANTGGGGHGAGYGGGYGGGYGVPGAVSGESWARRWRRGLTFGTAI